MQQYITNNTITTSGSSGYGIYIRLSSDSNTLTNNNISSAVSFEISDTTGNSYINYLIYNNSFGEIRWTDDSDNGFLKDMDVNRDKLITDYEAENFSK